jgi:hypothetical protein
MTAASNGAPGTATTARQVSEWSLTAGHVSGRGWHYVDLPTPPGPPSAGFNVRSVGLVTMTVSATLTGAPVQLRALDNGKVTRPSLVSFDPSVTDNAFSFTFADRGRARACGHTLRLQWRSPTHRKVALKQGDVVVNFTRAAGHPAACS